MSQTKRQRPTSPPPPSPTNDERHRRAFLLLGSALAFVTISTFVLVGMLPHPTSRGDPQAVGVHSMMALKHLEREWVPKPRGAGEGSDEEERSSRSRYEGRRHRDRGGESGDSEDEGGVDDGRSNEGGEQESVDDADMSSREEEEMEAEEEEMEEESGDSGDEEGKMAGESDRGDGEDSDSEDREMAEEMDRAGYEESQRDSGDEQEEIEGAQKLVDDADVSSREEEEIEAEEEEMEEESGDSGDGEENAMSAESGMDREGDANRNGEAEDEAGREADESSADEEESETEQEARAKDDRGGASPKTAFDPRVIHILETRFMQNQPHLVALARARLHLLRAVCLPTVLNQTAWGQFVWVIRTDPELNFEIKEELVSLLEESGALVKKDVSGEEHALTYVVGSNDNYIVSNSTTMSPDVRPFDVQSMLSSALAKPESIFAGTSSNMQSLLDQISSQRSHDVIMWTRLDADDGLNIGYMEYLQSQAVRYFLPERYAKEVAREIPEKKDDDERGEDEDPKMVANAFSPPQWTYWCSGQNVDWFLTDPVHQPDHKNGTVYAVIHSNVCVTPGVTVAMRGSFDPLQIPRLDHDKIISYLREDNGGELCQRKGRSAFDENDTDDDAEKEEEDDGTCFHMVRGWMSAVRSRTPTSAGMMGVVPDENQLKMARKLPRITHQLWRVMAKDFTIQNERLIETNAYFADHVYDIAEENAHGQCTTGHSCKTSSKDLLQQYVDLKSETRGGFDVVNGTTIARTE